MLDLAQELLDKYKIKKILYLCDNRRLRDSEEEGFPEQIEKWGSPALRKIITLECYQTTYKWKGEKYDLVLADEADFSITPEYAKVFFNNTFKYKILVTGTVSSDKKKTLVEIAPIVYRCSTTDAEKRGIINKTKYYIYNYRMTDSESKEYLKWTRALAKALAEEREQESINFLANKRREVLFTLDSSVTHCKRIMSWLWHKSKQTRLVIFSERTSQADRLCKWSFHGKNEKDDNLQKFQSGEISGIAVVSKIKRGINLKNANTAIFEALSSSQTEFEQRNGRMKRLETSDVAEVIFMCPWYKTITGDWKPTVVDTWITKATANLHTEMIPLKL
jgi:superfamily II DNA or RNA helicase